MASTIFHAPPCTSVTPSVKPVPLTCQNYVGLKPSTASVNSSRFNCRPLTTTTVKSQGVFVVKASETVKKLGLSDAECEAAVFAGKIPEAPPVPPKPAAPAGTPLVPALVSVGYIFAQIYGNLSGNVDIGEEDTPIGAMPGCYRLGWRHGLVKEVAKARDVGVNSIVLIPKVPDALKVSILHLGFSRVGAIRAALDDEVM
ncbi:hypothetical protein LWI28_008314 [Acer negundo]|uniref:Uncharacterized protein n=1 Tax=Acer negundo TaxID=4023 RepID=A0AAD5NFD7_ACENE|nr:hypothetical protein LWI28_008314 [Acer negundo]